jgi:hypothetical protein
MVFPESSLENTETALRPDEVPADVRTGARVGGRRREAECRYA